MHIIILVIIGFALFTVGFLIASVWQNHKVIKINTQLAYKQQELSQLKEEKEAFYACTQELEVVKNNLANEKNKIVELTTQLKDNNLLLEDARNHTQKLQNEYTKITTTLQHKEEQYLEIKKTKEIFLTEFENIANRIFETKTKTFQDLSKNNINNMLHPMKDQLERFQKRINEVHDASLKGNTSLHAEIQKILAIGSQMNSEANNLTKALTGDSQQLGAWGEAQLSLTLEMSGLIKNEHYETQSAFKDEDNKKKQIDCLIKLPNGKHIIIDSKVTLKAYSSALQTKTTAEFNRKIADHVSAVYKYINDLSSKYYQNLPNIDSPDFILMFMPVEPAYIEALKHDKTLFEHGYQKKVVLVSHTTLIPILRTIANLWILERSNKEARKISEKAGDIYNQLCIVVEHLRKLGDSFKAVSNHYNHTITAITGKKGLYGKVDRFKNLSTKINKELPQPEILQTDFEVDRLPLFESVDNLKK